MACPLYSRLNRHHLRWMLNARFSRLVVMSYVGPLPKRGGLWLCQCDCGKTATVRGADLRSGNTKSCGCLFKESARARLMTHGQSKTHPAYAAWCQMKRRCSNPVDTKYPLYGGRGISVCKEWQSNFESFARDMGPRPVGYSLDRIDNDGNYEPGNCRWAPPGVQSRNRRTNRWVEHEGQRMVASDFAALTGISSKRLYRLMSKGMTAHEAHDHIVRTRGLRTTPRR